MTRLLVSVRNAAEAGQAMAGGAHVIDIKEPLRGALGPADPGVWQAVQRTVAGHHPLSAALGELLADKVDARARACGGFQYAKIGLSGCRDLAHWPRLWSAALQQLPAHVNRVAVVYADAERAAAPHRNEIIRWAAEFGCRALLVDTFSKARGLFQALTFTALRRLVAQARAAQMQVVLAGSLTLDHLADAMQLDPDYVAVRGAVCDGDRTRELRTALVRRWTAHLMARQGVAASEP
jgi:uncharacterized protein (UPF0264 family)